MCYDTAAQTETDRAVQTKIDTAAPTKNNIAEAINHGCKYLLLFF